MDAAQGRIDCCLDHCPAPPRVDRQRALARYGQGHCHVCTGFHNRQTGENHNLGVLVLCRCGHDPVATAEEIPDQVRDDGSVLHFLKYNEVRPGGHGFADHPPEPLQTLVVLVWTPA